MDRAQVQGTRVDLDLGFLTQSACARLQERVSPEVFNCFPDGHDCAKANDTLNMLLKAK